MNFAESPQIDLREIKLSGHALFRMKKRFDKMSKEQKLHTCRCILGASSYLGYTKAEDGNFAHTFGNKDYTIFIGNDLKTIVSIYQTKKKGYIADVEPNNPLHKKLTALYETELRKYIRLERTKEKKLLELRLEAEVEKAQLKYRIHKTRSLSVKDSCTERINAIDQHLIGFELELRKLQDDKRKITKAMSCIV